MERQLAEGGIGVVVVATHLQLQQRVAIKYLQAKVLARPALVERFKREAQLAASLSSDHVVRVFDVGTLDDGAPYMVMEYLDGEDLGSVVARGPLPCATAVDYLLQACEAIAEAHALGIVHRDLKPENLFVAKKGVGLPLIKILDFGISKANAKGGAAARLQQMTAETERFGTPIYMSPEQLLSSTNVDARADIWALGVVLFELLTGEIPFVGENVPQITASIQAGRPRPLHELYPEASPALEAVILRCLEKDPKLRYRNAAEFAQELAPFATSASRQCIENINRIVRDAGESVRPSGRLSDGGAARLAATTARPDSGTFDAMLTRGGRSSRWTKRALLGALGLGVLGAALLATSAMRNRRASETTNGHEAPPAVASSPFHSSVPAAVADAGFVPMAETSSPSSTSDVPANTSPSQPPKTVLRSTSTKTHAPAHLAPVRIAPQNDRKPAGDYAEFGERR